MKLELRGITKRFPGVVANDHVDLVVEPGEIHGLLGENGAGKSTLMNILYGLYSADEGQILIDERPVALANPGDAIDHGIGMVHQHFMLVPVFTVAENILLGVEKTGLGGQLDRAESSDEVRRLSKKFGLPVDPDAVVEDLPVGVQQRVEILKALYRDAQLLILDEPTAVLTPQEIDDLFRAMRSLRESGRSIVFISHKLGEHREVADRVSVLRRGKIVGEADPRQTSQQELANLMVGRPVDLVVDKQPRAPGDVVLEVSGLHTERVGAGSSVRGVDLTVHAGEIVGIAGVEGNGQTELVRALTGLMPATSGSAKLGDRDLLATNRKTLLRTGLSHVPEDRTRDGLIAEFSVAENLMLDFWDAEPYARRGVLQRDVIHDRAEEQVESFDIRTPSVSTSAGSLSGGNQQKLVVARQLSRPVELLVCSQPTRGVDVGSIEYIHERIVEKRNDGAAVLIVSSELDEVLALSDRIAVIFEGRLAGPFPMPVAKDAVGRMMAGADPASVLGGESA